jgi:hypothetical protein
MRVLALRTRISTNQCRSLHVVSRFMTDDPKRVGLHEHALSMRTVVLSVDPQIP